MKNYCQINSKVSISGKKSGSVAYEQNKNKYSIYFQSNLLPLQEPLISLIFRNDTSQILMFRSFSLTDSRFL